MSAFTNAFTPLLQQAIAYASTLVPDGYSCSPNRSVLTWRFTPQGWTTLQRRYTVLPLPTTSAHEQLARTTAIQRLGDALHACLMEHGALHVGVQELDVDVVEKEPKLLCTLTCRDLYLGGGRRVGLKADVATVHLERFIAHMSRVKEPNPTAREAYTVNGYAIMAPSAATAVALYYATYEPLRFDDALAGDAGLSSRLSVARTLNDNNPTFLASLFDQPAAVPSP